MGYSCSVRASIVYEAIQNLDQFDIRHSDYKYVSQIGRENKDGSISGVVYEKIGDRVEDKDGFRTMPIKKIGSFRINANGSIARFPGVSKRMFGVLEIYMIETYDRMYA